MQRVSEEAAKTLNQWQNSIKERELADKRRVAPGWLDREEKILQPENTSASHAQRVPPNLMDDDQVMIPKAIHPSEAAVAQAAGEELDRAFGSVKI